MHQDNVAFDFARIRRQMVRGQLRPHGVTDDRIMAAMEEIPRELFVPFTHTGVAYSDVDIRLISNRYMMRPALLARLLDAAQIGSGDRVLELAPATGYTTLVLARLTSPIYSIEPDSLLAREAEKNIAAYTPGKATILAGAPVEGCISNAPFDVIFINGSVEFIPEFLFEQLNEGGRLVCVIRHHDTAHVAHAGQARLYRKTHGSIIMKSLFEASTPLAPGFEAPRGFAFQ